MGELTASELGTLAGLSTAVVRLLERGKRNGQADTLKAIAAVLGDENMWILTGAGEPPSKEAVLTAVARARAARGAVEAPTGTGGV